MTTQKKSEPFTYTRTTITKQYCHGYASTLHRRNYWR